MKSPCAISVANKNKQKQNKKYSRVTGLELWLKTSTSLTLPFRWDGLINELSYF
jgi:hypothetical protein